MNSIEKHFPIWLLEYKSSSFEQSLFLIWYTDIDRNETDKFLTTKENKILAFTSFDEEIVKSSLKWVNFPITIERPNIIDIDKIKKNIELDNLDDSTIEALADFINLFEDFVYQNDKNKLLEKYLKDNNIDSTWRYFYDYIFFPRFNDRDEYMKWNKPKLEINNQYLLDSLVQLVSVFENTFKVIK
ncbi:MAG: hypothetical protein ACK5KT_12540 [Dysgonomonas sp.]